MIFFKEITFIQQGCIVQLIKSDRKDIYYIKRFLFQMNAVLSNFLFRK